MSKTRDSLGIFWEGEEVDGLRVYGFWPREVAAPPEFRADLWPQDATIRPWKLWGEGVDCVVLGRASPVVAGGK